ncbi:hypothetical protein MHYP_G00115530 [Metynnis hypsauchen]
MSISVEDLTRKSLCGGAVFAERPQRWKIPLCTVKTVQNRRTSDFSLRTMASIADDDFCSLAEEKFDFDLPLSPASSKGEDDVEDEVFLGPISHMEKCVSHGVEAKVKDSVSSGPSVGEEPSWSPLLEENFEEICKEAHLLASHLERSSTDPVSEGITVTSNLPESAEQFEADTVAKMDMFNKRTDALSPIKRETFCVQDSPMKQLPPAIQKRLQMVGVMSGGKQCLSTSSPVRHAGPQPKIAPRGRSLVASNGVLPSKPIAVGNPRLSCTRPAAPSKTRLPAPSKNSFGLKRSPGSINMSKAGSTEDLLSDTASIASDVSDSSLNTSLPGKRGLSAPHKTEKRGAPVCKVPALHNRRVADQRRNTSSSSSSVSSINSSFSVSPTGKGKLNSSLNTSVSSISGRGPNSGSTLPSSSRKSGIIRPVEPSVGRRTSMSTQVRKSSEPLPRPVKATPIKRQETVSSVQHQTPARKTMERTISAPMITTKAVSSVKLNLSTKAFVAPTPTNSLKGVRRSEVILSPDAPRIMKPKKLMSACSVESLPQRLTVPAAQGLQTPSAAAGMPVQSKLRRPSALPTPVTRRVSGIPMLTPKSVPRLSRSSRTPEPQSTASTSEMGHASPGQLKQGEQPRVVEQALTDEEPCTPAELQPCSLVFNLEDDADRPTVCEPAAVEKASILSTEGLELQQPKPEVTTLAKSEEILQNHQKNKPVMQEVSEVLLVDAPAPVLKPEEKVLIDLANTPDLIKTVPNKVFGGQLIDLSSPLIKWSPEEKKENAVNEAPLINLSF